MASSQWALSDCLADHLTEAWQAHPPCVERFPPVKCGTPPPLPALPPPAQMCSGPLRPHNLALQSCGGCRHCVSVHTNINAGARKGLPISGSACVFQNPSAKNVSGHSQPGFKDQTSCPHGMPFQHHCMRFNQKFWNILGQPFGAPPSCLRQPHTTDAMSP